MLPEKASPRNSLRHGITKVTHCLVWGQVPAVHLFGKAVEDEVGTVVVWRLWALEVYPKEKKSGFVYLSG